MTLENKNKSNENQNQEDSYKSLPQIDHSKLILTFEETAKIDDNPRNDYQKIERINPFCNPKRDFYSKIIYYIFILSFLFKKKKMYWRYENLNLVTFLIDRFQY